MSNVVDLADEVLVAVSTPTPEDLVQPMEQEPSLEPPPEVKVIIGTAEFFLRIYVGHPNLN